MKDNLAKRRGMGCSARNSLASKNLALDVNQELSGKAMRQGPRKRHMVQNRTDEEFETFVMKTVGCVLELSDLFFASLFDARTLVLPKMTAQRITELWEVLSKGGVVVSRLFSEFRERRRGRLVECRDQLLPSLVCLELLESAVSPDIVDMRQSYILQQMHRLRLNSACKKVGQTSVNCPGDPQIARECWLSSAQSPICDTILAHSQSSSETAETADLGSAPKQTRQLLTAQQGRFLKSRSDHVLDLIGSPYFPVGFLERKKKIFAAVLLYSIGAKPRFAPMAVYHRAVFHELQSPKQRYVNHFPDVAPSVQASGAPGGNAAGQQLRGQERPPGKHREVIEVSSPGEPSDRVCISCRDVCRAVETGSVAPSSSPDRAGKHVAAPDMQWQDLAVVQCACRHEVCFSEAGKIACQAFDDACTKSGRTEVVKVAARWKLDVTQIQRFIGNHAAGRHTRLHGLLQ
jgi:hypothetical protein